ncbi:unnamed protein product [Amoebophrya sp. A25]|nr:unnamed protein product [Amoebophrya sp. A25]|eukprot:GSA25T00001004001.1
MGITEISIYKVKAHGQKITGGSSCRIISTQLKDQDKMIEDGANMLCRPLYGSTALFSEDAHGTCPFYLKIGACRHGDQCSRHHVRPTSSQTLMLTHLYPVPAASVRIAAGELWDEEVYDAVQKHLEDFYDEVFHELATYGEIEDMIVADNVSEHMLGNIYVKYFMEEDAEKALQKLTGRYYSGRLIRAEFSPVTDFREARCRAFHEARCNRGGYCNFLHIKHIPRANKRRLILEMYEDFPHYAHKKERLQKKKPVAPVASSTPCDAGPAAGAYPPGLPFMAGGHGAMSMWDPANAWCTPADIWGWGGGGKGWNPAAAYSYGGKSVGGKSGSYKGSRGGTGGPWMGAVGSGGAPPTGGGKNYGKGASFCEGGGDFQPAPPLMIKRGRDSDTPAAAQTGDESNPPWPKFDPQMLKRIKTEDGGGSAALSGAATGGGEE